MNIYIADFGWAGSIAAIADSEQEAREFLKNCYNYTDDCQLEVQSIAKGLIWENLGDT